MASYDEIVRLLHCLSAIDVDVQWRCALMEAKCRELERVLAYVDRVIVARSHVQEAAQRRQDAAYAQARSLENSLDDAVRRARQIRLGMTEGRDDDHEEEKAADLAAILAQARAIRAQEMEESTDVHEHRTGEGPSMEAIRLEYPRRMRLLMEQLEEARIAEKEQSFRDNFCRKMTEHMSRRDRSAADTEGTGVQLLRVQVPYTAQVERLRRAYRRLGQYFEIKANPQSEQVRKAVSAPSMSSVFPVYSRLKQARAVLTHLNTATASLTPRLPPPPSLSQATIAHRDDLLRRLRKKTPHTDSEDDSRTSNRRLLTTPDLQTHLPVLDKLQAAWEERGESANVPDTVKSYRLAVDEVILSEVSALVLSAFQHTFCDDEQALTESDIREVMRIARVAESTVVFKARKQRSMIRGEGGSHGLEPDNRPN